ncbi:MAG: WecB/TagA/CpsF family glycosyltransferase [Verrucomicrobiota bacterium]|jgi:N-acetylglucosaminyldiphosphoundecaprenol N-acetyl-beta-D-mannosaminyltransferase
MNSSGVLGTRLQRTTYSALAADLQEKCRGPRPFAVDFTNTHIVTLRRHDPEFRKITSRFDYFIPDAMPLIWCLNCQRPRLRDRIYGPTFMRECMLSSPAPFTHYFLGGSDSCVKQLKEFFLSHNPAIQIVGARNGYFKPEQEMEIVEEINRLSPDFIWLGLGTPKQQAWIYQHKDQIRRGILLAVGFAFDVNAGLKPDAPRWMQRAGLTWLFRLCSEPRRLGSRYLKFNVLFLHYLLRDGFCGRAWAETD